MNINTFKKIELFIVIAILFSLPLLLFGPKFTSFQTADSFTQEINLVLEQSKILEIKTKLEETKSLTFLAASGEIIGNGYVGIYLTNGKENLLVWDNIQLEAKNRITGYASAKANYLVITPLSDLEFSGKKGVYTSGKFQNACIDTCLLDPREWTGQNWRILVYVQPGTKVKINSLIFGLN
ncbi:MAG: hypothetical protein QXQ79_00715 [Candidatus Nanoarchaeia archaeon]